MPRFRITTGVTFELYAKDHAEATGKAIEKLHTLDMISDIPTKTTSPVTTR